MTNHLNFLQVSAPTQAKPVVNEEDEALNWLTDLIEEARANRGIISKQVRLTPARAKVLLDFRNPDNRAISKTTLNQIKSDIKDRRFIFNGEPIIVSLDGMLNDGQHRCLAVVETKSPIDTMITVGVSRESRLTVDTGRARTTYDFLHMSGVKNSKYSAQVSSMLYQWRKFHDLPSGAVRRPTKVQVQACFHDNASEIELALNAVPEKGTAVLGGKATIAFCYLLFREVDKEKARTFLDGVLEGIGMQRNDPIQTLRQRLISSASGGTGNSNKLKSPRDRVEAYIRTWNAYVTGSSLSKIQVMGNMPKIEKPRE